jgi:hypothetical protein
MGKSIFGTGLFACQMFAFGKKSVELKLDSRTSTGVESEFIK